MSLVWKISPSFALPFLFNTSRICKLGEFYFLGNKISACFSSRTSLFSLHWIFSSCQIWIARKGWGLSESANSRSCLQDQRLKGGLSKGVRKDYTLTDYCLETSSECLLPLIQKCLFVDTRLKWKLFLTFPCMGLLLQNVALYINMCLCVVMVIRRARIFKEGAIRLWCM